MSQKKRGRSEVEDVRDIDNNPRVDVVAYTKPSKKSKHNNPLAAGVDIIVNVQDDKDDNGALVTHLLCDSHVSTDGKDDNGALSLTRSPLNVVPGTPTKVNHPKDDTESQTPISILSNFGSEGRSITEAGSGVSVKHVVKDGEYVLKIRRMSVPSSSDELNEEEANQLVQSAGMLFAQAEILRGMGEQLLAHYRACLQFGDLVALTRQ